MKDEIRNINPEDFFKLHSPEEKIKFLLRYAILAPSTHNSQPWLFKIKEASCEVYYDKNLRLPHADPESRDLFISIGCAIENLILSAKYFRVFESAVYRLSTESNFVAEIKFKSLDIKNYEPNPDWRLLTESILKRVNARGIFLREPVSKDTTDKILQDIEQQEYDTSSFDIDFLKSKEDISRLAELTGEGIKIAYSNKKFREEISRWLRNNLTIKKDGLAGYSLRIPFLISLIFPFVVRYVNVGNKLAELNKVSIKSAPLICVMSAQEEDKPLIWVNIGRIAERLMLEFNREGYNTSIFVASIEMKETYKKVQQLVNITKRPQFIFAIGKIDLLHRPTPRHPPEEKIIR